MNILDTLERRLSRFAIPGLMRLIVILNALVFLLGKANPNALQTLALTPDGIARHEYWRLITYIFIPDTGSFVFILFALWFLWMIGEGLEHAWGAFRLNLFYLLGMLGTTLAALAFGADFSNTMLNLSLFFAFAWFYPDMQIYALLVIPMRVRWMAWFLAAVLLVQLALGSTPLRMALIACFANYLIFFGPKIVALARARQKTEGRRRKFAEASLPADEPLHRCAVCRRSEIENPDLEFRVARDGKDYCLEHLPKAPVP